MKTKQCPHCAGTGIVPDDLDLGSQLKAKRVNAGLKLKDLAKATGLSVGYISDLEHGRRRWSPILQANILSAISSLS